MVERPAWAILRPHYCIASLGRCFVGATRAGSTTYVEGQLGFRRNRDWLASEFFMKGTPPGYHALGFVSFLAVVLTGLRFPYAAVAIAAMMLTAAWGEDRRRYPSEKTDES